ncbi:MFS transporter [Saccharopolyspora rosea]|uniref:MFS transporter n=1 Tax=Saccharopolyspora rosea TaxID=524884 RepID=A0ABW3FMD0_9PSEU|nr:MFS transporter [Saccharopolyspora rosea]
MLRPYRLLASVPHAPALMCFSLLGRLHMPAVPLTLTFLCVDWTGSYALSGVLGAAMTLAQAVAGPLRGRAADRSSAPKLLVLTGLTYGLGMAGIVLLTRWVDARLWWLGLPVAAVTGLCQPPVTQIGRAVWPRLADGPAREAAYAVEATLQELLFVVTPVLAAFAVAYAGPVTATLLCASWAVCGPALFALALRRAGIGRLHEDAGSPGGAPLLRVPGFASLMVFSGLVVGGLISTDLLLVGWARDRGTPELAGVLSSVWAVGSLLGGLLLGGRSGRPRLWLRALCASAGLFALVPALPPVADPAVPWLVAAILLVGGSAVAPTLAAGISRVGDLAPDRRRSEAFGWFVSATTLGGAVASPLAGWMLDHAGPAAAAGSAAVMVLVAAGLVARHSARASRGADRGAQTAVT